MSSIALMPNLELIGTKSMSVSVTAADIALGVMKQCDKCPIARALTRIVGPYVSVGVYGNSVTLAWADVPGLQSGRSVDLPASCIDFALAFDAGEEVKPFAFEIAMPRDIPLDPSTWEAHVETCEGRWAWCVIDRDDLSPTCGYSLIRGVSDTPEDADKRASIAKRVFDFSPRNSADDQWKWQVMGLTDTVGVPDWAKWRQELANAINSPHTTHHCKSLALDARLMVEGGFGQG